MAKDDFDDGFDDGLDLDLEGLDFGFDDDDKPKSAYKEFTGGLKNTLLNRSFAEEAGWSLFEASLPKGFRSGIALAKSLLGVAQETRDQVLRDNGEEIAELADGLASRIGDSKLPFGLEAEAKERLGELKETAKSYRGSSVSNDGLSTDAANKEELNQFLSPAEQEARAESRWQSGIALDERRARIDRAERVSIAAHSNRILNKIEGNSRFAVRGLQQLALFNATKTHSYYNRSLEVQYRTFQATRDIRLLTNLSYKSLSEGMKKLVYNTGIPDTLKARAHINTLRTGAGVSGNTLAMFNSGYLGNLSKSLRESVSEQISEIFNITSAFTGDDLMRKQFFSSPSKLIGSGVGLMGGYLTKELLAPMVGSKIRKHVSKLSDKLGGYDHTMQHAANDLPGFLNRFVEQQDGSNILTSIARGMLDRFMPVFSNKTLLDKTGYRNLDNPATFTQLTQRSIVDIIPGYLARLLREVRLWRTGTDDAEQYDVTTGTFSSRETRTKNLKNNIVSRMDREGVQYDIESFIQSFDRGNDLSREAKKGLSKVLIRLSRENKSFEPEYLVRDQFYSGISPDVKDEIQAHTRKRYSFDDDNKLEGTAKNRATRASDSSYYANLKTRLPNLEDEIHRLTSTGMQSDLVDMGIVETRDGQDHINSDRLVDYLITPPKRAALTAEEKEKWGPFFVRGKISPVLTPTGFQREEYYVKSSRRPLRQLKDITGPIINRDGKVIITQRDLARGLYNENNECVFRIGGALQDRVDRITGRDSVLGRNPPHPTGDSDDDEDNADDTGVVDEGTPDTPNDGSGGGAAGRRRRRRSPVQNLRRRYDAFRRRMAESARADDSIFSGQHDYSPSYVAEVIAIETGRSEQEVFSRYLDDESLFHADAELVKKIEQERRDRRPDWVKRASAYTNELRERYNNGESVGDALTDMGRNEARRIRVTSQWYARRAQRRVRDTAQSARKAFDDVVNSDVAQDVKDRAAEELRKAEEAVKKHANSARDYVTEAIHNRWPDASNLDIREIRRRLFDRDENASEESTTSRSSRHTRLEDVDISALRDTLRDGVDLIRRLGLRDEGPDRSTSSEPPVQEDESPEDTPPSRTESAARRVSEWRHRAADRLDSLKKQAQEKLAEVKDLNVYRRFRDQIDVAVSSSSASQLRKCIEEMWKSTTEAAHAASTRLPEWRRAAATAVTDFTTQRWNLSTRGAPPTPEASEEEEERAPEIGEVTGPRNEREARRQMKLGDSRDRSRRRHVDTHIDDEDIPEYLSKVERQLAQDIYVGGEKYPIIRRKELLMGDLLDKETLTVIRSLDDINGPVIDKHGNIVLDQRDIENGLYNQFGDRLLDTERTLQNRFGRNNLEDRRDSLLDRVTNLRTLHKRILPGLIHGVCDIYVKGEELPRLTAKGIRARQYIDVNTGRYIDSTKDITGPVREGNEIILTPDELKDLVDQRGRKVFIQGKFTKIKRAAIDKVKSLGKGAFDRYMRFTKWYYESLFSLGSNMLKHVFTKENTGRLLATVASGISGIGTGIKRGATFVGRSLVNNAKRVIPGLNRRRGGGEGDGDTSTGGNRVLSSISRLGTRISGTLATQFSALSSVAKKVFDPIKSIGGKVFSWIGLKAKSVLRKDGRSNLDREQRQNPMLALLAGINDKILSMIPKRRRRGDWTEIQEERARAGESARERSDERRRDKAKGPWDLLKSLFGRKKKKDDDDDDKDDDKDREWDTESRRDRRRRKNERDKRRDRARDRLDRQQGRSRGSRAARRTGRAGVRGAKALGRFGMDNLKGAAIGAAATYGAEKLLGEDVGGTVGNVLTTALVADDMTGGNGQRMLGTAGVALATRLLPLLANPYVLVGAAITGVVVGTAYLAWSAWKSQKHKNEVEFAEYRFAQYGVLGNDDLCSRVLQLEEACEATRKGAVFNNTKIQDFKLLGIMGVDKGDQAYKLATIAWYAKRFMPVYLKHIAALEKAKKGIPLGDAGGSLPKEARYGYLIDTCFPFSGDTPYAYNRSPWGGELPAGIRDIEARFEALKMRVSLDVKANATEMAKIQSTKADGKSEKEGDLTDIGNNTLTQYDPFLNGGKSHSVEDMKAINARLGVNNNAKTITEEFSASIERRKDTDIVKNALRPIQQIRYYAYGCKLLTKDIAYKMAKIEDIVMPLLKVNDNRIEFTGDLDDIKEDVCDLFGVPTGFWSGNGSNRVFYWLKFRFLPFFIAWADRANQFKDNVSLVQSDVLYDYNKQHALGTAILAAKIPPCFANVWSEGNPWEIDAFPGGDNDRAMLDVLKEKVAEILKALDEAKDSKEMNLEGVKPSSNVNPQISMIGTMPEVANRDTPEFGSPDRPHVPLTIDQVSESRNSGGSKFSMASNMVTGKSLTDGLDPNGKNAGVSNGSVMKVGDGAAVPWDQLPVPARDKDKNAVVPLMQAVSKVTGVDYNTLMSIAGVESGFESKVKAGVGTASGLFQFIDDTWRTMLSRHGKKYGLSALPKGVQDERKGDPRINALMGAEYIKENWKGLRSLLKREPTAGDVYMAHFLGMGGVAKLYSQGRDAIGAEVMPREAAANKPVFFTDRGKGRPRTVQEIINLQVGKLENFAKRELGSTAGMGGSAGTMVSVLDQDRINNSNSVSSNPGFDQGSNLDNISSDTGTDTSTIGTMPEVASNPTVEGDDTSSDLTTRRSVSHDPGGASDYVNRSMDSNDDAVGVSSTGEVIRRKSEDYLKRSDSSPIERIEEKARPTRSSGVTRPILSPAPSEDRNGEPLGKGLRSEVKNQMYTPNAYPVHRDNPEEIQRFYMKETVDKLTGIERNTGTLVELMRAVTTQPKPQRNPAQADQTVTPSSNSQDGSTSNGSNANINKQGIPAAVLGPKVSNSPKRY